MKPRKTVCIVIAEDKNQVGRPIKRKETFKLSLCLDKDLRKYIKYTAMKQYKAVTMYINDLIRAEMEKDIENGADASEWERLQIK